MKTATKLHCPMCSNLVEKVEKERYGCPACGFHFVPVDEEASDRRVVRDCHMTLMEGRRIADYEAWQAFAGDFALAKVFFARGGEVVLSEDGSSVMTVRLDGHDSKVMLARAVRRMAEAACESRMRMRAKKEGMTVAEDGVRGAEMPRP